MFPFIESIKVSACELQNLPYHEQRMEKSLAQVCNTTIHPVDFEHIAEKASELNSKTIYKLRVLYGPTQFSFSFAPYTLKPVHSLCVLEDSTVEYEHKFSDRTHLKRLFDMRGNSDDIIICRHGALTDSYYCNLAFLSEGNWYTPDLPLLHGTRRAQLIEDGLVREAEIYIEDIPDFERIRLFNAMIGFGEIDLNISSIRLD